MHPASDPSRRRPLISIVTPAYNESENLPILREQLTTALETLDADWEWIIVDDHSRDTTFAVVQGLAKEHPGIRGVRLARNFGSHTALACGLHFASGDCAIVMAADLQDPPSTVASLFAQWRQGAQVVWAVRQGREGEKATTVGFACVYYTLMRRVSGLEDMPSTGADFFLIDRAVIDALAQFRESNVSILALLTWMGFRQDRIYYTKQSRFHGRSGWSFKKKLKLVVDSITSFTYFPIRLMTYTGMVVALLGFLYSFALLFNYARGQTPQGWTSLMVVVLVIGGIQMLMMGVLGEYLWRALDEARGRPRFLVEETTPKIAAVAGGKAGTIGSTFRQTKSF